MLFTFGFILSFGQRGVENLTVGSKFFEVRAYFGDIAGLAPDYWNKENIANFHLSRINIQGKFWVLF